MTGGHNRSIHGLRGLAILAVILLHLTQAVQAGVGVVLPEDHPVAQAASFGHRGVDLFFMISGYLIAASLVREPSPGRFLIKRAVRIYPAFVPPHILLFIAGPLFGYAWMRDLPWADYALHFASNFLFLPGFFDLPVANLVAWSLSLEMVFYLVAAAAAAAARPTLHPAFRCTLGAVSLAAASWALWRHPRMWFFAAGALAYALERRQDRPEEIDPTSAARQGGPRPAPTLLPALALAAMGLLFDRVYPAAVACGLVAFVGILRHRDVLCRLLQRRTFQYLGDISYSLYLWHLIVILGVRRVLVRSGGFHLGPWTDLAAFLVLAVFGSLLAAHLSYRLVEQWFTDRVFRRRPACPADASAEPVPYRAAA